MKKWMRWSIGIAVIAILLVASYGVAEQAYLKRKVGGAPFLGFEREYGGFQSALKEEAVQNEAAKMLNIPVYEAEELMHNTNGAFYIGRDCAMYRETFNTRPYTNSILNSFPTEAIRQRDETSMYFIYQSDSGFYLYLFFSEENGDPEWDGLNTPIGYPIVICKMLRYEDFSEIQVGDGVEKLREIDPVIAIYESMFFDHFGWNTYAAEHHRKNNNPISSIHYLKDGLLKIEYDIIDDTQLVVENIIFDENYDLTNLYGETYNYRILPQDLPEA